MAVTRVYGPLDLEVRQLAPAMAVGLAALPLPRTPGVYAVARGAPLAAAGLPRMPTVAQEPRRLATGPHEPVPVRSSRHARDAAARVVGILGDGLAAVATAAVGLCGSCERSPHHR